MPNGNWFLILYQKAEFYEIDINSKEIKQIFKKEKYDIVYHPAAQIDISYFNVDETKSDPGWKADYFIEEGLAKAIGYYCS